MASTNKFAARALAPALLLLLISTGCAQAPAGHVPVFDTVGSRLREYSNLNDLARRSSAIVVAEPTGKSRAAPLPDSPTDTPPTTYVTLTVTKLIAGVMDEKTIEVVSPGIDTVTGQFALLEGGPYLLFLTPAMYAADTPAGGYVVTGMPAGLFASTDGGRTFLRVDDESPLLPESVTDSAAALPKITQTKQQLLQAGP